jgi:4-hydroxy-tetrahydrodipicolinate reductase
MIKLIVTGVGGKVGSAIFNLALKDGEFEVVGALEAPGHPLVGKAVSQITGESKYPFAITDNLAAIIGESDVVIDFTEARASMNYFRIARENKKAIVIGSTGFTDDALAEIGGTADARVVISPNMSVGMNLMFDVVEKLSRIMKDDYDIEIIEMHHKMKKDAPSGTAVKLKEIVEASEPARNWIEVFGRKGITGERKKEELGILALRGGDVVGEHTVMFAGVGERLEVTHRAYSRENFARGALLAAKWLSAQGNGIYSMKDVLGI